MIAMRSLSSVPRHLPTGAQIQRPMSVTSTPPTGEAAEPATAGIPPRQVQLKDGSSVTVRQAQPRDTERLAKFLQGLNPQYFRSRFPVVASDLGMVIDQSTPISVAASLSCGNLSDLRCMVSTDAKGDIVGMVDYSKKLSLSSMLGFTSQCEAHVHVSDSLQGQGLDRELRESAKLSAQQQGYSEMVCHQLTGSSTQKETLDLSEPLADQK